MLQLEQARARILSLVQPLASETVPLSAATGRILAEDITAPRDLPVFDNSAMDGYALRAQDVAAAGPQTPAVLRLIGNAPAGQVFSGVVAPGQCVRVFTGSPLPSGADAVAMQEDTELDPSRPGEIRVLSSIRPWENVRFRGTDVKSGTVILRAGEKVRIAQIGLLAALGRSDVLVRRQPLLGLIATGNELCEPGPTPGPGRIYESNRASLAALASEAGAQPRIYPLVPDDLESTKSALEVALSECDAVVSSGGVSVGELDHVKAAFETLGGELAFWRVAVKPGKPFASGTWRGKLLFALPGNPVSAFVTFLLLVRPAVRRMQGANEILLPIRTGVLVEALSNSGDRRHFVRVSLNASGQVVPTGPQASHLLLSLANANGLVDVPPNTTVEAGATVPVLCWES